MRHVVTFSLVFGKNAILFKLPVRPKSKSDCGVWILQWQHDDATGPYTGKSEVTVP
jgi:hypothetical protein